MDDKSILVGFFQTGSDGPKLWVKGDGEEGNFLLTLTLRDAWALSTLIDQSILACINSHGGGIH